MGFVKAARALVAGAVVVGSVAVGGTVSAAPRQPDLVVTSVNWAPDVVGGQQVLFSATIANRGTAATPAGTISGVGFQVDGKLVTWADRHTASIAPGQSVTVTAVGGPTGSATWTATAGQRKLRAFVDDAKRIAESNEGNNTLDTTVKVAAGITHRIQSGGVVTRLSPVDRTTVTATSVSGNIYVGCFSADGRLVDGTERFLRQGGVGNDTFALGSKFADGLAEVPAGATQSGSRVSFSSLIWSYQGHFGITCAAEEAPNFTRFQATSVRTTRWYGSYGTPLGAQLASVSTPVDVDFDVQP
ncbi:CARDB domain-containing protein [Kineococcus sp. SYSU DK003]|uniref:CARDB domain-containing protein n=1 Tax=Kineococcus sp. SYSU DK003 TaxID=3383124 RepID=UPI003D7C967C